jgi:hypothetical protein
MTHDLAYSYAALIKSEKQEDGTLKVYGKATDDSIDIDQQICDDDWLKRAMPDWFVTGGNVREQHSNIAAGVATDYEAKADGHYITALVVDPVSVKKVEAGVLKGFSIGIRGPRVVRDSKAAGGRIVDGQIIEISLVDRPANPNAKLMLAKAADGGVLEAVKQLSIPSPAELAKHTEPTATLEEPIEGATMPEETTEPVATEEVVAEPVTEEVVTEEVVVEETVTEEVVTEEPAVDEAVEIVEAAKSLLTTLNKFDQATYDRAVAALADLIFIEAEEMKIGHNEHDSIRELLDASKHLTRWYEGEVREGEVVTEMAEEEDIYMAADAEMESETDKQLEIEVECDCDGGEDCSCGDKMCKCNMAADKSATLNVTVDDDQMNVILNKAVASAKAAVIEEIDALKTALEAETAKSVQLEQDLATAKKAAVAGGPARAAIQKSSNQNIESLFAKAAEFRQKAAATQDKTLAEGYRELAGDLEAKARTGN